MKLTLFCAKAKTDRNNAALCREVQYLNKKLAEKDAKIDELSATLAQRHLEILTLKLASMENHS